MRRRNFIAGLASTAAAWPVAVRAQQTAKKYRIGYLSPISASVDATRSEGFLQGLHELGYVEGTNIIIERRFAEGSLDQLSVLAADLVRLNVDLIVAAGGDSVAYAVKNITATIPIVITNSEDPVASRFAASLAHPGGNITGLTTVAQDLSRKRLQLLRSMLPNVANVAVVWNSAFPNKVLEVKETQTAATALGLQIISVEIQKPADLDSAFEEATKKHSDALISLPDPLTNVLATRIIELASTAHLPTMFSQRPPVEGGGLMSYGPNYADLFRRAAAYVDKILRGSRPADLPVEQPTKFELVINLKTAKAFGLTIPPTVLAIADEVIE